MNSLSRTAVGERTSLIELYQALRTSLGTRFAHLEDAVPTFGPFRGGDVRHSLADISKARGLLGYEPSHRLDDGIGVAMGWYLKTLSLPAAGSPAP